MLIGTRPETTTNTASGSGINFLITHNIKRRARHFAGPFLKEKPIRLGHKARIPAKASKQKRSGGEIMPYIPPDVKISD